MPKRKRTENLKEEPLAECDTQDDKDTSESTSTSFEIPVEGKKVIPCERHGTATAKPDLIFTHGASGGLAAPAMQDFATGFAENSSELVMFKGNMNMKSRVAGFDAVIKHEDCHPALGGRSMGARAACLAAQESDGKIDALVLVSFPLVGAQKGDSREQVLLDLPAGMDVLFMSGSRDSMCDMSHLREVVEKMEARSWVVEVEGANHGMALEQKAGSQSMRVKTGAIAAQWLKVRDDTQQSLRLRWDEDEQAVVDEGWQEADSTVGGAEASPKPEPKKRKTKAK